MNRYLYLIFSSFVILGILFVFQSLKFNDGKFHMVFCNVGQGDAIFIRTPNGSDILVDGGPDDSVLNCLSNHMPFWDRSLELVILSHPHSDHLTGLISVIKRYTVMSYVTENLKAGTVLYKRLQDTLAKKNLTANYTFYRDRIDLPDKTEILTLWPSADWVKNQQLQDLQSSQNDSTSLDVNGFSLVQLISYGNFTALLTGDAGSIVEDEVSKNIGRVTVLKVPHHGSKTGMDDEILNAIRPAFAIISVGSKNRYGHPSAEALSLLNKYKVKTFRTDKNGEVEIVTDGKSFNVFTTSGR